MASSFPIAYDEDCCRKVLAVCIQLQNWGCVMGLLMGLKNMFSARGKAVSLYEQGMKKAKRDDFQGAISDYNEAMKITNVPEDIRAMLLLNRGLAWSGIKEYDKARADLQQVLTIKSLPANIASAAREKLERMNRRTHSSG